MVQNTENVVFSVNNHLTTRQDNERSKGVMARIQSYDVVETNNEHLSKLIKQYSQMFDLCGAMKDRAPQHVRHLFMEGDHKYKDNHSKANVHCFLLTDMLLACKSIAKNDLGSLKWPSLRIHCNAQKRKAGMSRSKEHGLNSARQVIVSANNSHSGSVEWNDSRNASVDFEKTNSLSSDEGCHGFPVPIDFQ
uniref:Uncharacterized protein n=1 Tax=Glossina pallidipes TaxID=7398 RepID=A0A1B0ACS0_GLOPL